MQKETQDGEIQPTGLERRVKSFVLRFLLQMVAGVLYKFDLVLEHNQDDSECQQVGGM